MGQYMTLQKQVTVTGDTSSGAVHETMPLDQAADVSGWGVAFVTLHALTVGVAAGDTVEIDVGTVDDLHIGGLDPLPSGAAGNCVAFSGVTSDQWYKAFIGLEDEPQGAGTYPLENWMGWHVGVEPSSGGGAFSVTFEIFVTLKQPC